MVNTQSALQVTLATSPASTKATKWKSAGTQHNAGSFSSIMSPLVQQTGLSPKTPSAMAQATKQFQQQLPAFRDTATTVLSDNPQPKEVIAPRLSSKARGIDPVQNTLQRRALQQSKLQASRSTQQPQMHNTISDLRSTPTALPPAQRRKRSHPIKNYDIGMEDRRASTSINNMPPAQKRRTTSGAKSPLAATPQTGAMNFSYEKTNFDIARTALTQQLAANKSNKASTLGASQHASAKPNFAIFASAPSTSLGALAAKFESGSEGIAAIGYDRTGGTSYGKYQISSKAGTMQQFISFLKSEAPDLAKRLQSSGPANTGNRQGSMPATWKKIATENPTRFESLQEKFIHNHHFEPALQHITAETGINFKNMPMALQEVLFSTAVQHGPAGAVRIINRAIEKLDLSQLDKLKQGIEPAIGAGKALIKNIYAIRSGQFSSSTPYVQMAARNRLQHEMNEALELLTT